MLTDVEENVCLNDKLEQHYFEPDILPKNEETVQSNENLKLDRTHDEEGKESFSEVQNHDDPLDKTINYLNEKEVSIASSGFVDILSKNLSDLDCGIENKEEKQIQIVISTPNNKCDRGNILDFGSLVDNAFNNTNSFLQNDMSIKLPENNTTDEYLNDTIDEAIFKYENNEQKEYKDAYVQTIHNLNDFVKCKCSTVERQPDIPTLKSPLSKKKKSDNHEYFFMNYKNPLSQTNFSNTEGQALGSETFQNEEISYNFKATSRIRLGLSKRARPQPLINK